jgi:hypothetical protein
MQDKKPKDEIQKDIHNIYIYIYTRTYIYTHVYIHFWEYIFKDI